MSAPAMFDDEVFRAEINKATKDDLLKALSLAARMDALNNIRKAPGRYDEIALDKIAQRSILFWLRESGGK